jgi:hypothetical protein
MFCVTLEHDPTINKLMDIKYRANIEYNFKVVAVFINNLLQASFDLILSFIISFEIA